MPLVPGNFRLKFCTHLLMLSSLKRGASHTMSGIRINAGEGRGRKLRLVPGTTTRPVSDRVKQALFNIIGADITDAALLDLFAGTGSVGIEALSRGARSVLFIDNGVEALKTVQFNLANTGYSAKATVLRADAINYLGQPRASVFDYIYIAPPQYQGIWREALGCIDAQPQILSAHGRAIVQLDPKEHTEVALQNLILQDTRRYGSTMLAFYGLGKTDTASNSGGTN